VTATLAHLPRTAAVLADGLAKGLHIGAQLYVSKNLEVIADAALGAARPATDDAPAMPMTPDTIMLWFSASKPLTAVAIAQLVETNRLDLDAPIAAVLPEFAAHGKSSITPRHILTHTAGLRTANLGWPQTPYPEIIHRLCQARPEPNWPPGQAAGYHAFTSWFILGELVHRITGFMIDRYLREFVFQPLGMTHSFLAVTPTEYANTFPRMGIMQRTENHKIVEMHADTLDACTNPRPPGSGHGPIRELGTFYEAMLRGGARHGQRILQPETVTQFTTVARRGLPDRTFGNIPLDWGLGFMTNSHHITAIAPYQFGPYASDQTFGHHGSQSSVGCCDPTHDLVIAYVFNGCPGDGAHDTRLRATFTALYQDLGLAPA
jgi:CubicO group peptidase (beta-lactamase class C family)